MIELIGTGFARGSGARSVCGALDVVSGEACISLEHIQLGTLDGTAAQCCAVVI
jgi:hypothetical protein